mmetsp:Transcript_12118/g.34632  ORF Transcript_12118/g.34632 Transcript_12118/m.34632 type:complete len:282 (-) Transcript_12118:333-1178(-)
MGGRIHRRVVRVCLDDAGLLDIRHLDQLRHRHLQGRRCGHRPLGDRQGLWEVMVRPRRARRAVRLGELDIGGVARLGRHQPQLEDAPILQDGAPPSHRGRHADAPGGPHTRGVRGALPHGGLPLDVQDVQPHGQHSVDGPPARLLLVRRRPRGPHRHRHAMDHGEPGQGRRWLRRLPRLAGHVPVHDRVPLGLWADSSRQHRYHADEQHRASCLRVDHDDRLPFREHTRVHVVGGDDGLPDDAERHYSKVALAAAVPSPKRGSGACVRARAEAGGATPSRT